MDLVKLVNEVVELLTNPKNSINKWKDKKITKQDLILYLAIVGFPTFLGLLIGYGFVSGLAWNAGARFLGWGFVLAIIGYVGAIIGILLFAFIFNMLAVNFKSKQNLMQAAKLVSYAATPWLILGIFNIFPTAGLISLLGGIYGLYILYLGIPILMKTPEDQVIPYLVIGSIIFIIIMLVVWGIVFWIWNAVAWGAFWSSSYPSYLYDRPPWIR